MITHLGRAGMLVATAAALAACSLGPTSKTDLCAGFAKLDKELAQGNVGFGNPLFKAAARLGDLADRYPGGAMAADAAALHAIGDNTDTNELRNATMHISATCGRPPVGLGGLMGGS